MPGDSRGRSRSALLTRWRGAVRLVREQNSVAPESAEPAAAEPAEATEIALAPAMENLAASFSLFEAELLNAVARPTAEKLLQLLAPSRTAVLTDRNAATCATSLAQLDLLEDVLDALLLVKKDAAEGVDPGPAPP